MFPSPMVFLKAFVLVFAAGVGSGVALVYGRRTPHVGGPF